MHLAWRRQPGDQRTHADNAKAAADDRLRYEPSLLEVQRGPIRKHVVTDRGRALFQKFEIGLLVLMHSALWSRRLRPRRLRLQPGAECELAGDIGVGYISELTRLPGGTDPARRAIAAVGGSATLSSTTIATTRLCGRRKPSSRADSAPRSCARRPG